MTTPPLFPRQREAPETMDVGVPDIALPVSRTAGPWGSRAAEMAAIFMVGDGLIGLLQPRRHVDLWKDDALGTEKLVKAFVDRPGRRRLYAVMQIAAGLTLAARQKP